MGETKEAMVRAYTIREFMQRHADNLAKEIERHEEKIFRLKEELGMYQEYLSIPEGSEIRGDKRFPKP